MCRSSWIHRRAQCRRISSRRARQADRACAYAEICGLFYGTFRTTDRKAVFSRHRSRTLPHGMPQIALPAVNLTVPSVQPTINCSLRGQSHGRFRIADRRTAVSRHVSRSLPKKEPRKHPLAAGSSEASAHRTAAGSANDMDYEKPTQYAAHLRNSAGNRPGSISQQTLRMLYISLKHCKSTI